MAALPSLATDTAFVPVPVVQDKCIMSTIATPFEDSLAVLSKSRKTRKVIVVLSAFGDESSDETHQRVFAVGALFGNQDQWDALEVKWRARTGDVDFHATECDSDKGVYASSPHADNKKLYKDLTVLLAESRLLGYGAAIDLIKQNEHMKDLLPESPYYRCFGEVVIHFAEQAFLSIPQEPVKFIFDRRLEIQYNATALYDYLAKLPEWEHHSYIHDEVGFASRKTVGVQAADLWTREIMKHLDNIIGPVPRAKRRSMEALEKTKRFGANLYTGDFYTGLQQRLNDLDKSDGPGAFKRGNYKKWLIENKLGDSYATRVRYAIQYDAIQRAQGNPTHFDDVGAGRSL